MAQKEYKKFEEEIWKDLDGFEGVYQVSNLARFKSFVKGKEKILKTTISSRGYQIVTLRKKTFDVHRLVAIAFVPNPNNYPIVNHKDENRANPIADNLEWCTYQYNNTYGNIRDKIAEKRSRKVYQYTLDNIFIKEWDSINQCGREGFSQGNVCQCCNNERKKHKGFIWSFTPLDDIKTKEFYNA